MQFFFRIWPNRIALAINILHPGVLLLTKMKRWYHESQSKSTRPKTISKILSDKRDLDYLVSWLAENNMTIEFEQYRGKTRDELMKFVCRYWLAVQEDEVVAQDLKKAMKERDRELLLANTLLERNEGSN